jgi:hypothetical protein
LNEFTAVTAGIRASGHLLVEQGHSADQWKSTKSLIVRIKHSEDIMKYTVLLMVVLASTAFSIGTTFPNITFQDNQVVIVISDIEQISIHDLPGYITIDLRNFNKLHFRRNLFQVINEEMNGLTAYQSLPYGIEIMKGKKVRLIILKFEFTVTKNMAKEIFRTD